MKTDDRTPHGESDRAEKSRVPNRPYKRSDLAFVRVDDHGETNCWAVTPSGDAKQDFQAGFNHGRHAVAFAEQAEDSTQLLGHVFRDMVAAGEFSYLEAGFVNAVSHAALLHHNTLRLGWIERGCFGEPIVLPGFSQRTPGGRRTTGAQKVNPAGQDGAEDNDPRLDRS